MRHRPSYNRSKKMKTLRNSLRLLSAAAGLVLATSANAAPSLEWFRTFNNATTEAATYCQIDKTGNLYVVGVRDRSATNYDVVLSKYTAGGVAVWTRFYAGAGLGDDDPSGLVIDSTGNVYLSVQSQAGGTIKEEGVLLKYSPAGSLLFTRKFNGIANGNDSYNSLTLDKTGNLILTGTVTRAGSGQDAFCQKMTPAGVQSWISFYTSTGSRRDEGGGAITDGTSNTIFVSEVAGSSATDRNAVVRKLSPTGGVLWTRMIGATTTNEFFMTGLLDNVGNPIGFCAEYNPVSTVYTTSLYKLRTTNGTSFYGPNRFAGSPAGTSSYNTGLVMDGGGNLYAAMGVQGMVNNVWTVRTVLVKYNYNGVKVWERSIAVANTQVRPIGIVIDGTGNTIIATSNAKSNTPQTTWLYKYNAAGSRVYAFNAKRPAPADDEIYSFQRLSTGQIYLIGSGKASWSATASDGLIIKVKGT